MNGAAPLEGATGIDEHTYLRLRCVSSSCSGAGGCILVYVRLGVPHRRAGDETMGAGHALY